MLTEFQKEKLKKIYDATPSAESSLDGEATLNKWYEYMDEILSDPQKYEEHVSNEIDKFFAVVDADKDGNITEEEFQTIMATNWKTENSDEVFAKLDLDGNGYLDRGDMEKHSHDLYYSEDRENPVNVVFLRMLTPES